MLFKKKKINISLTVEACSYLWAKQKKMTPFSKFFGCVLDFFGSQDAFVDLLPSTGKKNK